MEAVDLYAIWLVTSVIAGLVGAWAAQRRNRNPLAGFVIGAIANVLILVWLYRRAQKAPNRRT